MLGIYARTSRDGEIIKSTINQQINLGIKFCVDNNIEYDTYKDEGISGYKISDDDLDPFNNRPEFTRLINDIKNKKINKVWVLAHDRISRNQYASAFIFNIFEKHNIKYYVKNKIFDLNDPTIKLTRQMLDAIAEYERHLIVGRTTRGLHKSINEGRRSHSWLYGYEKIGKDQLGYMVWKPVESEIENYKYILQRFLEGESLRKIVYEISDMNKNVKSDTFAHRLKISEQLKKYQYTGYQLTLDGLAIYKQFRKNEIENLKILLDRKYWVKSIPFPLELISIENWIKVNEKLQIYSKKYSETMKGRTLRATSAIGSGIINCGICDKRYYFRNQKNKKRIDGSHYIYSSYYHTNVYSYNKCSQRPKTFLSGHIDEILKLFIFYSYLVFDDRNDLIKESLRIIKQTQIKLKEKIAHLEKEEIRLDKLLTKYNKVLQTTEDIDIIYVISKNIKTTEDKLAEANIILSKTKIEYELENDKFNKVEREITYYDVKERILNWFKKMKIEEQREELLKIIKSCNIYGQYILIDSGKIVFFFDIEEKYIFDKKLLKKLDRDEIYKLHFIKLHNKKLAKTHNEKMILDINLDKNEEIRLKVTGYLKKNFNIKYDLKNKKNFISFVSLRGLHSKKN
jgi:DNA invertase Pin-like site-specific DNA recombinase